MIEINSLSKRYKLSKQQKRELGKESSITHIDAVKEISFTCKPGRVFTLLGPNGAGKTTTLRMIATMLKPTSGTIKVAGFDTVTDGEKVRRQLGFLTGGTGLYDRLTPHEMVKYHADLNDVDSTKFKANRDEIFARLGIEEYANRRIAKLSTGMKQKVSIARTIIHDPDVLVFDEPTAGLDVIASKGIIELIRTKRDEGKTIIFSTHIMSEVSLVSDDLAIIHQGELLYDGTYRNFESNMQEKSLADEFIRLVEGGRN
ncbi:MAG: ATP-binding cassette domain-containing protein [Calditrichaeota bacterium]|nr:MAG: ATP-binding cassette domain-containing protein [Calditrichota bacterium]